MRLLCTFVITLEFLGYVVRFVFSIFLLCLKGFLFFFSFSYFLLSKTPCVLPESSPSLIINKDLGNVR